MILKSLLTPFFPKQRLRYGVLTYVIIAVLSVMATPLQPWPNLKCRTWDKQRPFRLDDMVTRGTLIKKTHMI